MDPPSRLAFLKRTVLPETTIFALICMADLAWTVYSVKTGTARETNPLLAPVLAASVGLFVLVKGISFMFPLAMIELIRTKRERFIAAALRIGIALYLFSYLFGSLFVNHLPIPSFFAHS